MMGVEYPFRRGRSGRYGAEGGALGATIARRELDVGRFMRVGAVLVALLMIAGALAGCGGDQQAEADEAMARANAAMEEWTMADQEFAALAEEFGNSDPSTPEGIEIALSLIDEMEAKLEASTEALKKANSEMATILDLDVDEEYKTYVQMLIESNDSDLASDDKGREIVAAMRDLFTEAVKDAPDEALLNELGEKANELAAEMDELDAEARSQAEAAEAYFTEQGFIDSAAVDE